jgi:hypothetical protein
LAQRVTACRVAVPTVLHVHAASLDEPVPPPDVRLSLQSVGETLIEDEYVLSLVEAEDVATWLTAAARDPEVVRADDGDLAVTRETYSSIEGLDPRRLKTNDRLPAHPWLALTVGVPLFQAGPGESWVMVRFDDQLVRESGSDGCLWLLAEAAQALAQGLARALEHAKAHPPLVDCPTGDHIVADLRWD